MNRLRVFFEKDKKMIGKLVKNDFKARYSGSYLGVIWGVVQPLITVLIYWFVFTVGLRNGERPDGSPYIIWMMSGIVAWFFFSDALGAGTNAFLEYSYLVKKLNFNVGLIPLVKVGTSLIIHAIFLGIVTIILNFSGYTDLVTAIALLLGIRIPENFNMPYAATNLRDFWHRWHISLSTWIRDYLYIPLGGNRHGYLRTQANLTIAMLLSGLWHGASNNYLIWGAMHAGGLILLNLGDRLMGKNAVATLSPALARYGTIHYIVLTWAVFYSNDADNTRAIFRALGGNLSLHAPVAALALVAAFNLLIYLYPRTTGWKDYAAAQWRRLPWHSQALLFTAALIIISAYAPSGIPSFLYSNY